MVKVAVENAEKRTIVETITANGKIQPEKEVKLTPDVSGEIVEVFGALGYSIDDWAAASGTINYEIVTRIASRVPRIYA